MAILSYFGSNRWCFPHDTDTVQWDPFQASVSSQSWKWLLFLSSCHSGGKQTFLVTDHGDFVPLDKCTESVATIIGIVDGLCDGGCSKGVMSKLLSPS